MKTVEEAECVINLMEMNYSQCDALLAAKLTHNVSHAIDVINQNCGICEATVSAQNIIGMLNCTHTLCKECTIQYFTNQVIFIHIILLYLILNLYLILIIKILLIVL